MLNVPYFEQLAMKNGEVEKIFSPLIEDGAVLADALKPILGMEDPFHYRDKVIAPFVPAWKGRADGAKWRFGSEGRQSSKGVLEQKRGKRGKRGNTPEILTGMYAKGTHEVVDSSACLLENPVAEQVVKAVRSIMVRHGVEPYDEDSGRGFMRHAVVRVGHGSGEVLVTLVTNSDEFPHSKSFCRELVSRVKSVTSVVQSINTRQTNVVMGDKFRTLYGPGFILDDLCGLKFRISPGAFYQVNSTQTEVLYETAVNLAGATDGDVALDAYCGTGTIGLVAAARGDCSLVGVDSSKPAISDARMNASHNGIEQAVFIAEDATGYMERLANGVSATGVSPAGDVVNVVEGRELVLFMDPPRSGSTPEFVKAASKLAPSKVVYISCNPKTQVRDIGEFSHYGYKVTEVQPVDMFPHTPHIETVALLERA